MTPVCLSVCLCVHNPVLYWREKLLLHLNEIRKLSSKCRDFRENWLSDSDSDRCAAVWCREVYSHTLHVYWRTFVNLSRSSHNTIRRFWVSWKSVGPFLMEDINVFVLSDLCEIRYTRCVRVAVGCHTVKTMLLFMDIHTYRYTCVHVCSETVWCSDSKEHPGAICVLRHGVRHFTSYSHNSP